MGAQPSVLEAAASKAADSYRLLTSRHDRHGGDPRDHGGDGSAQEPEDGPHHLLLRDVRQVRRQRRRCPQARPPPPCSRPPSPPPLPPPTPAPPPTPPTPPPSPPTLRHQRYPRPHRRRHPPPTPTPPPPLCSFDEFKGFYNAAIDDARGRKRAPKPETKRSKTSSGPAAGLKCFSRRCRCRYIEPQIANPCRPVTGLQAGL